MHPFEVLSDPVRLGIVRLLFCGEQTSGDIASTMYDRRLVGWPTVSQHLGVLRESGFVNVLHDGPRRWYFLRDDWLDLVRLAVDDLDADWRSQAADRELGFVRPVFAARLRRGDESELELPEHPPELRRSSRGRGGRDLSARGVGRSHDSDDADGSSSME